MTNSLWQTFPCGLDRSDSLERAWGVRKAMKHAQHNLPLPQPIPLHIHMEILTEHTHIEGRSRFFYFSALDKLLDVTWDQNLRPYPHNDLYTAPMQYNSV